MIKQNINETNDEFIERCKKLNIKPIVHWSHTNDSIVYNMGFVGKPAIDEDFIFLSNYEDIKLKIDEEKRIVIGPALIPNILINRGKYSAFFKEEDVEFLAHKFLNKKLNNNATKQHLTTIDDGVFLNESWVVEHKEDKINLVYGFDLPIKTWCLHYYIENEEIWNDIKSGKINGFSIEAKELDAIYLDSYETSLEEDIDDLIKKINKII